MEILYAILGIAIIGVLLIMILDYILIGKIHFCNQNNLKTETYLIEKDNYFEVQNECECAAFASAYLLRHLGHEIRGFDLYDTIPKKFLMNNGGVYPKGVIYMLNQYHHRMEYCRGNISALCNEVAKGNPVIVLIKTRTDKNWLHYDSVVGFDSENIYLAESYKTLIGEDKKNYNRKIPIKEFQKLWRTNDFKMPLYKNTFYRLK